MDLPRYRELLLRDDAPAGSSWGLFAEHPERGMANLAGPAQVLDALGCVRRGLAFNLDYPLNAFDPPMTPTRRLPRHEILARHEQARDDLLDDFFLQSGSHLDGLRHRRASGHGFYNGVPDNHVTVGTPALGVQRWAERPIVGRGLLLDLERVRAAAGAPIDHAGGEDLEVTLLDDAARLQQCDVRPGDILLVYTGWARWYLDSPIERRRGIRAAGRATGFRQSRELPEWMWDHAVATLASDTYAVEVVPARADSPFRESAPEDGGLAHQELLGLLGLPLGELWNLTELAADCRQTGQWASLVCVHPLNLVGGVGSPANATALR